MLRNELFSKKNNTDLYDPFSFFFQIPGMETAMRGTPLTTDIKENDTGYNLEVAVPGVNKEDINIALRNGYLTVRATKKEDTENKNGKYISKESFYGSVKRSFYVGDDMTEDDISATYKDGVLIVSIPKKAKEDKKVKQIEIK